MFPVYSCKASVPVCQLTLLVEIFKFRADLITEIGASGSLVSCHNRFFLIWDSLLSAG